jgi:hypothetical protein
MPISRADFEEIQQLAAAIETAMQEIDGAIRRADQHLYDQWKAYGKQVTDEFVSMGPSLSNVVEQLEEQIEDENEGSQMTDSEADADALASAGMGTDEDYNGGCTQLE